MTLALATRGYLTDGTGGGSQVFGPGPQLVSSAAVTPEIDGSKELRDPAPEIVGAAINEPVVVGAKKNANAPAGLVPDIVGSDALTPGLK